MKAFSEEKRRIRRQKKAVKFNHRISQQMANEMLQGNARFCQIVLRRDVSYQKAGVPFFAYVVETGSMVHYIPAVCGVSSGVIYAKQGDILSISDGRKKADKLMPPRR